MVSGTEVGAAGAEPGLAPGVLVLDDDVEIVEIVAEALTGRGYRVLRARDGLVIKDDPSRVVPDFGPLSSIDVVITDLVMPSVSGIEVIRDIRKRNSSVPIIAISGMGDEELRREAIRFGAVIVLHKPFDLDDLLRLVRWLAPAEGKDR